MIFVKGGKFNFGSNIGLDREKPEHEVIIQSFLIDKNLVTVEDFRDFVNKSNYITERKYLVMELSMMILLIFGN